MKLALIMLCGVALTLAEESNVLRQFAANNVPYIGNLYKEVAKAHPKSFLICPLSIQTVFALVHGGARGETARQISTTLRIPQSEEKLKQTYLSLGKSLQNSDKYTSSSANKIYVADHFNISEQFRTSAVKIFSSEIQNINFAKSQAAVAEINHWIADKTHNKVKNVVSEDIIDANTQGVFVNALYFQGTWVKQFKYTVVSAFYTDEISSVPANLMHLTETFNYYKSAKLNAKFLELPYEGNDISMTIVLPVDFGGLSFLEAHIHEVLVTPQYTEKELEVAIPKFNIETETDLIPVLSAMGISDAFSPAADFSGIGENHEPLTITNVLQKSFIEVDEKGTTAAAATLIIATRIAGDEQPSFIANHPFLFYLKHRAYGVFFVGRYSEPGPFDVL